MKKKVIKVITHSGNFHADEVFAVSVLNLATGGSLKVTRTRDLNKIDMGDFVVDVGRIYSVSKKRFDHHQSGGAGKRKNGVPYASFGLVWKEYGRKICGGREVAEYLDKKLVQFIDAQDCGHDAFTPKKDIYPYTISQAIGSFNPAWNEKETQDTAFAKALKIAEQILKREISKAKASFEARKFVTKAYKNSKDKRIITLDHDYPWREFMPSFPKVKFVIYPEKDSNSWVAKAVRKNPNSFVSRKSFPKTWAGKSVDNLRKVSGVKDAVFCHNNLFLAVARTKDGATKLAKIALKS